MKIAFSLLKTCKQICSQNLVIIFVCVFPKYINSSILKSIKMSRLKNIKLILSPIMSKYLQKRPVSLQTRKAQFLTCHILQGVL